MNAFLWVGVQGANALEFLIRPRFQPSNSRYLRILERKKIVFLQKTQ
ncbi:hypothetical protein LEP1GSC060_0957 [Leptospira weilii serovar Ranarum str. ICFT]|uniref:Uncharacterized protein n=1 Tax=Leptospira weilii serovar Ranarum str. ICFT TaxID=1218598 RepID=N1WJN3_9LEPT|nr:hypothetical protein LEP1GSC060_0957 [Leptospira weilii serovar Ranarum str. ICFT]